MAAYTLSLVCSCPYIYARMRWYQYDGSLAGYPRYPITDRQWTAGRSLSFDERKGESNLTLHGRSVGQNQKVASRAEIGTSKSDRQQSYKPILFLRDLKVVVTMQAPHFAYTASPYEPHLQQRGLGGPYIIDQYSTISGWSAGFRVIADAGPTLVAAL